MDNLNLTLMNFAKNQPAMYTLLGNANKFYAGKIKILIDLFNNDTAYMHL